MIHPLLAVMRRKSSGGGSISVSNNDFTTWSGGTSVTMSYTGSVYTNTPSTICDNWTVTGPNGSPGPACTLSRQTYATGSGSDVTGHGSYMMRMAITTFVGPWQVRQSVAVPSGAAGLPISVPVWVKGSGWSTYPTATVKLGSQSSSATTLTTAWQKVTLTTTSGHGFSGTSQNLDILLSGGGGGSPSVDICLVEPPTY